MTEDWTNKGRKCFPRTCAEGDDSWLTVWRKGRLRIDWQEYRDSRGKFHGNAALYIESGVGGCFQVLLTGPAATDVERAKRAAELLTPVEPLERSTLVELVYSAYTEGYAEAVGEYERGSHVVGSANTWPRSRVSKELAKRALRDG